MREMGGEGCPRDRPFQSVRIGLQSVRIGQDVCVTGRHRRSPSMSGCRNWRLVLLLIGATLVAVFLLARNRHQSTNSNPHVSDLCPLTQSEAAIADRLRYRRQRIRHVCDLYGEEPKELAWPTDIWVDSVVWRKIPKVASSYLTTLFLRRILKNATLNFDEPFSVMTRWEEEHKDRAISDISEVPPGQGGSLLVVRNPYDRLVSAYFDKVARDPPASYWKEIRRVSGQQNSTSPPTFPEFVDFVLWQYDYVPYMDGHWAPQEEISRVCTSNFQYIVQMETMDEEMPYVVRMLGFEEEARVPIVSRNKGWRSYDTMGMLDQLTKDQLNRIDSVYHLDALLFSV